MTPAGIAQLKLDEGFRANAYPDPKSGGAPYTIAYGHTGPDVRLGMTVTELEGAQLLAEDLVVAEKGLAQSLSWFANLDPVRQDVLANIAFNVGVHGLLSWPHTLSLFEAHDWAGASDALLHEGQWNRDVGARAMRLAAATLAGSWA